MQNTVVEFFWWSAELEDTSCPMEYMYSCNLVQSWGINMLSKD